MSKRSNKVFKLNIRLHNIDENNGRGQGEK